jgi:DNA-binding NarL/FixJ family response regulator
MRVVLVGSASERARLRERLAGSGVEIAGESPTIAAARQSGAEVDAFLVASEEGDRGATLEPLTPRELQVIELMADGLSNRMIAVRLGISDQTVKFHVAAICGKLGAMNRTDAVRRAIRLGLVAI